LRGQCVEGVGDGKNPRADRYIGTLQSVRVSRAIEEFVMLVHDFSHRPG
jgi:hypothetical protein